MGPRRSEAVGAVDRAWLRMDEPTNHMVVTGLLLCEGELDVRRVRELVGERIGWIPRLRMRVEGSWLGTARWCEVDVDLAQQVRAIELGGVADESTLMGLIGEAMSERLDPGRPLWELRVITGVRGIAGARSALLARVHHALGDGLAQMLVLLSLTDGHPPGDAAGGGSAVGENPLRHLFTPGSSGVAEARAFVAELMPRGMKLLLRQDHEHEHEHEHRHDWAHRVRRALAGARSLTSLVVRRPDASTILRGRLGVTKRAVWSRAIALDELHRLDHQLGATVNDVLLSAVTGGLRRYLISRGESPMGVELRAALPINLRRLADMASLGNRFGLLFTSLPIHIADPHDRLVELQRRIRALEHSAEPMVTWAVLDAIDRAPRALERQVTSYFAARVSMVMTNMPGPERSLWLAGERITGLMFWVPQSGRVGLGISICSYAGAVRVGIASDAGLVPDPEGIIAGFHEELDAMR